MKGGKGGELPLPRDKAIIPQNLPINFLTISPEPSQLFLKIYPLFFWELPENQADYSSKRSLFFSMIILH